MKMDWKDVCPECDYVDIVTKNVRKVDNDRNYECKLLYDYSCPDCGCEWTVSEKIIYSIEISKHGDTCNIPC